MEFTVFTEIWGTINKETINTIIYTVSSNIEIVNKILVGDESARSVFESILLQHTQTFNLDWSTKSDFDKALAYKWDMLEQQTKLYRALGYIDLQEKKTIAQQALVDNPFKDSSPKSS